ncbi:hypothetical protein [Streptomyces humi]|uniref:hypothetical protein n=1 Tax=Streptomyces humi TaxID=1428620 RepID=UPI001F0B461E
MSYRSCFCHGRQPSGSTAARAGDAVAVPEAVAVSGPDARAAMPTMPRAATARAAPRPVSSIRVRRRPPVPVVPVPVVPVPVPAEEGAAGAEVRAVAGLRAAV